MPGIFNNQSSIIKKEYYFDLKNKIDKNKKITNDVTDNPRRIKKNSTKNY